MPNVTTEHWGPTFRPSKSKEIRNEQWLICRRGGQTVHRRKNISLFLRMEFNPIFFSFWRRREAEHMLNSVTATVRCTSGTLCENIWIFSLARRRNKFMECKFWHFRHQQQRLTSFWKQQPQEQRQQRNGNIYPTTNNQPTNNDDHVRFVRSPPPLCNSACE